MRHIASSRVMFLGIFEHGSWKYPGHGPGKGASLEDISNFLEACQIKLTEGLLNVGNDALTKKVLTLHGHEVSAWRILMAIPEHEIHYRGQLSTYLQINKIEPPQIFGLKIEQVKKSIIFKKSFGNPKLYFYGLLH